MIAMVMVNAPTIAAAACQHQAWPQRANRNKILVDAYKFPPQSPPGSVDAIKFRQVRSEIKRSAATHTRSSASSSSSNEPQLVKGSKCSQARTWAAASLTELLVKVSCRLVGTIATLSLMTQPLPAQAGDIIQGMPRVSDGDTIQVNPPPNENDNRHFALRLDTSYHVHAA